jgi:hypothetical protein
MLQYFATNRGIDELATAVREDRNGRKQRIQLSKGGYYFVDMERYFRYYLATTDDARMPPGAVVRDSKAQVFDTFLNDDRIGRIVVCVHGFNVELYAAATWFRVLTDTTRHLPDRGDRVVTTRADLDAKAGAAAGSLTAFIGFSWPSNGQVFAYASDQRDALGSAAAFGGLLARLRSTGKAVSLVCHSMGNYMACHALASLVNEVTIPQNMPRSVSSLLKRGAHDQDDGQRAKRDFFIDTMVMIAADVERRHVTKCDISTLGAAADKDYVGPFYSGLEHLVRRKVNLYSRFDSALNISNLEKMPREAALSVGDTLSSWSFGLLDFLERNPDQKWEQRLGSAPAPINAAPGFSSINATEVAGRKMDHGDHIDAAPVVARIAEELAI